MSKESVELLSHHVRNIRSLYPGTEGMEQRLKIQQDALRKLRFPNGEPLYPDVTEEMSQAKIRAIRAVLGWNYSTIPDYDVDGNKNFDSVCYSCSNYTSKPEECRAEKIANAMSILERIRFGFYLDFNGFPVRFKSFLLRVKEHLR